MTWRPWAFIYNPLDRVRLSSYDKPNHEGHADDSVDLLIRPKATKGLESKLESDAA